MSNEKLIALILKEGYRETDRVGLFAIKYDDLIEICDMKATVQQKWRFFIK